MSPEVERLLAEVARLRTLLDEIRDYAEDRVDADCVGDPPTYVGNDWSTIVNMIDGGSRAGGGDVLPTVAVVAAVVREEVRDAMANEAVNVKVVKR